jgi:lysophospholipase L1-like esterase
VNQWIRGHAHVADWDNLVSAEGTDGQYTTDTIHPSEKGTQALARMIEDQVRACGG